MFLKKCLAVAAMAIVFEAVLSPSLTNGRFFSEWEPAAGVPSRASSHYVLDVIRENRTGLGSLEELKLAEVILMESLAHKIDPLFVLALIETESTFNNWSRSFRGAIGLMQIQPATGEELAGKLNLDWQGEQTLFDPYTNVKMGVRYFADLKRRYRDLNITLAAYNTGPGRIDSMIMEGSGPEDGYALKVLENYKKFKERAEVY